jgi:hypothetical protein
MFCLALTGYSIAALDERSMAPARGCSDREAMSPCIWFIEEGARVQRVGACVTLRVRLLTEESVNPFATRLQKRAARQLPRHARSVRGNQGPPRFESTHTRAASVQVRVFSFRALGGIMLRVVN